jgi:hypothetical protein
VSESATALDTPSASQVFLVSISESVITADSVIGRFLWEIIDDAETANWQVINAADSNTWGTINNAQTSGWTTINTSDTANWSIINDNESTTWATIKTVN